jgi:hypothetical protein
LECDGSDERGAPWPNGHLAGVGVLREADKSRPEADTSNQEGPQRLRPKPLRTCGTRSVQFDAAQRIGVQRRAATCRAASEASEFTRFYHVPFRHSESTSAATPPCAASACPGLATD